METNKIDLSTLPPPPSVIRALVRGFNTVANHIYLILLPVLLDVFLWLGPQVKAEPVFTPLGELLKASMQQIPEDVSTLLTEFSSGFNLLTVIRTFPVGVFSLFSAALSTDTPLGPKDVIATTSVEQVLLVLLGVNLIGILLGAIYFHLVSTKSLEPKSAQNPAQKVLNVVLLNLAWTFVFMLLYIPIGIVAVLLSLIPDPIRSIVGLVLMVPASWFVMFYFFSFFPLFLFNVNIWQSIKLTWKAVRFGLPTLGWFAIVTLIISQGMDYLWRSAPSSSWMAGVGVLGHGFIATGLLSASFIFFLENIFWIELTLKKMNKIIEPGLPANE